MKIVLSSSTKAALILATLAAAGAGGCFASGLSSGDVVRPTLVAVDPVDFLGKLTCSDQPGTLRRYVATFSDVTGAAGASSTGTLASALSVAGSGGSAGTAGVSAAGTAGMSAAGAGVNPAGMPGIGAGAAMSAAGASGNGISLPSSEPVSCSRIVVTSGITLGNFYTVQIDGYEQTMLTPVQPGSRQMSDATGQVVLPRWTTHCDEHPVEAVNRATQFVRFCAPLVDHGASSVAP